MAGNRALELLTGESSGHAFAMTWAPPAALRALTWDSGVESEPEALATVASALSLDLAFVPASVDWAAEAAWRLAEDGIAVGWIVDGPFGRVAAQLGWEPALAMTASRPGELAARLDEALHESLEDARNGLSAGAEVLLVADELAGASGWLVSPDYALDALIPCYRRIVVEWQDRGPAAFHSDGDVRAVMPALSSAGFAGIHLGLPGSAGLQALVAGAAASGLCAIGGIGVQELHEHGARHTGERAADLARLGRIIIADDGGMSAGEELAAFSAALDVARNALLHTE
ncbi:MAG TPA: uroporphyrinogen decarboxylase family protein [Coriobacteriia bacterium]|nr:uroporphyrinogen decarboxylase family protein [Coriobacteriia bacterium]